MILVSHKSQFIRLKCVARPVRYEVGKGKGRSGLSFVSGLLSLVISCGYGRGNPPPSAVLLRSFGASEPGGPPSHNSLKSRRPSSSHYEKTASTFTPATICCVEAYSLKEEPKNPFQIIVRRTDKRTGTAPIRPALSIVLLLFRSSGPMPLEYAVLLLSSDQ